MLWPDVICPAILWPKMPPKIPFKTHNACNHRILSIHSSLCICTYLCVRGCACIFVCTLVVKVSHSSRNSLLRLFSRKSFLSSSVDFLMGTYDPMLDMTAVGSKTSVSDPSRRNFDCICFVTLSTTYPNKPTIRLP